MSDDNVIPFRRTKLSGFIPEVIDNCAFVQNKKEIRAEIESLIDYARLGSPNKGEQGADVPPCDTERQDGA